MESTVRTLGHLSESGFWRARRQGVTAQSSGQALATLETGT